MGCANRQGWQAPFGISEVTNERFLQYVIWRGLMHGSRLRPRAERWGPQDDCHDLVLYDDQTNEQKALIEIKTFFTPTGEKELPGIRRDMRRLGSTGLPGAVLVLTRHGKANAEKNFEWLADR